MAGELERRQRRASLQRDAEARILTIRGKHVIVDTDLASFYEVEVRRLTAQVERNAERFPEDFAFRLTPEEWSNLKAQIGSSSWGGKRKAPWVFTEQGALQAAGVLRSGKAAEVSVEVARAFVKMRHRLHQIGDLSEALDDLRKELREHIDERTLELEASQADLNAQVAGLFKLAKVTQQALNALERTERHLPPPR